MLKFSSNKKSLEYICKAKYLKNNSKNSKMIKVKTIDLGNGYSELNHI